MTRQKIIKCACGNIITANAETHPNVSSSYGFESHIEVSGGSLDHFQQVLCMCWKVYSIKRFVNNFHRAAVKEAQA